MSTDESNILHFPSHKCESCAAIINESDEFVLTEDGVWLCKKCADELDAEDEQPESKEDKP